MSYVLLFQGVYLTCGVAKEVCDRLGYNSKEEHGDESDSDDESYRDMHQFFNMNSKTGLTMVPYYHKLPGYVLGYLLHEGEFKDYLYNQVLSVPHEDLKSRFQLQKDLDEIGLNINSLTVNLIVVNRLY